MQSNRAQVIVLRYYLTDLCLGFMKVDNEISDVVACIVNAVKLQIWFAIILFRAFDLNLKGTRRTISIADEECLTIVSYVLRISISSNLFCVSLYSTGETVASHYRYNCFTIRKFFRLMPLKQPMIWCDSTYKWIFFG